MVRDKKEENIVEGIVTETLPNAMFRVRLDSFNTGKVMVITGKRSTVAGKDDSGIELDANEKGTETLNNISDIDGVANCGGDINDTSDGKSNVEGAETDEDQGNIASDMGNHTMEIVAYLSGKMKYHRIRVIVGDTVEVLIDKYGGKGRLVKRK